jgi:carbon-monoxide dehydrogenase medium subunit
MSATNFELHQPGTLEEALQLLQTHRASVKVLAGGTDLVPRLKAGVIAVGNLDSLKRLSALEGVTFDQATGLVIGGCARLSDVAAVAPVKSLYPALFHACSVMATTQIRNMGTVAGNVANAAPSADTAAPLLVYDAEVTATSPQGSRTIPLAQFFSGPGKSVLEQGEIITAISLPAPPKAAGSAYLRASARSKVDICAVGVAGALALDAQGRVSRCRLALAAVAPTPLRCAEAEEMLTGQKPAPALLEKAALSAAAASKPIDDMRASAAYRRHMVGELSRRVLGACLALAQGGAA